ncbi:MAG: LLM class flavin-dependent oxidoreductase [Armatimonadota bacterium]|nr:LLM class flavin-dependent oxidoreductase [Armatimonadota bacterium]MDR7464455.1 LLM class flavin-dependent oxidoreductase [Armatimonadota bacterium]MDR7470505.1 LLM class flavin-dependent oxidoreductase [Armatimonadota bacterium]MDR7475477.1 LLM class flavin-dependent oxidoreductase [Armatimonadota bacterium]MDR7540270.1 LLM class flavin-dependent oxidoreductase [Armatimonadota bacterium]
MRDGPVRFSFTRVPSGAVSRFVDFARYGRDLGFDRLWVPDQTYYADPFVVLTAVAAALPELETGLAVTNPYTRHPVQIARAAATVAEVRGGRFLLGLGAGNRKHVLDRLGIDGSGAAAHVREATLLIRRLLRGETVEHEGTWTLRGIRLEREGAVDIPIFIGTRNPRMLRVAGEVADGLILEALVTPQAQAYGLESAAAGARAAGRSLEGMEVVAWQSVVVTDDRPAAVEAVRGWVAYLLGMTTREVALRMGIRSDVMDPLLRAFHQGGTEAARAFVGTEEVDRVVIVGDPEAVAARCLALARGGATDITVQVWSDDAAGRETLRRFAQQVRPLVAAAL